MEYEFIKESAEIKDKTDEFPWGIGKVVAWWSQPLFYDRSNT